tara:strand:- start:1374 stop:2141 length:768 start_codon:yes stop_codon:yes gene_type:complete
MAEEAQEQESAPTGLLDNAKIEEPEKEVEEEELDHVDKAASGERPDWLPERFWDEDKGADYEGLAKSQQELYKKLRGGKHDAPEDGNYDLKFAGDKIAEDDELMTRFKTMASDRGLTQDDFESIVGMVLEAVPEVQEAPEEKFDMDAEMSKLGPNAEAITNGLVKWAESLVHQGAWTGEDFEEFKIMGGTANGIRALNRLRNYYGEKDIPVHVTPDAESMPTEAELREMVADPRYNTDTAYRRKVTEAFAAVYPD